MTTKRKTTLKNKVRKKTIKERKKVRKKCPICKAPMMPYQDYSGTWWRGCNKCESYEELI